MKGLLLTILCLTTHWAQAQDSTEVRSVWEDGSQWDVYYTVEAEGEVPHEDSVKVTYCLRRIDDIYLALEKTVVINHVKVISQLQGYIRNDYDTVVYVRPVLEDGSIGDEHLLYDFTDAYGYGGTIRYGVISGEVRTEFIDWNKDSLDYYMMNNGDEHCLPAWRGIVYKYGYLGGPMSLFMMEAAPGKARHPKPTNISHVIFSTKGGHKIRNINGGTDEGDVVVPYDEMLTKGTTWECLAVSTEMTDERRIYTICVKGDTLIGERLCKQLYSPEYQMQITAFEEGRKVYVVKPDKNPELLLDFDLQEGDRLNEVESVTSVDRRENQGRNYRVITIDTGLDCHSYFAGDTEPWNYQLIEGIGASKDQYLRKQYFFGKEDSFSYLLRCWKDGNLVYQAPGYETVTGISEKRSVSHPQICDLQGRRLNQIPQKGIYISGNKKIICR